MPELPEVETVKNVLNSFVKGRKIIDISILRHCTIMGDEDEFVSKIKGETINYVSRIGKFLIFHLTNNVVFISHLRMEGKYYEVNENDNDTKYARVVFHFDNNKKLCYDDSRCFGIMILSNEEEYLKVPELAKLGPEPFKIEDTSFLYRACRRKNLPIKTMLLDQSLMTGLGNIYVDEVLFASKIHPWTPAYLINKEQWDVIVDNAKKILYKAIEMGGSTIKSYHPGKGIDGNFQTAIQVYGKSDEPCPRCGATLRFVKTNGRGTTFCPHCQRKKGSPITIAITGVIGSGKSTALDVFKKQGYDVISSDKIVSELYQENEVTSKIVKSLKIEQFSKDILRNHLKNNPQDIKKVERIVHPLVISRIKNFIKCSKSELIVAEVPLLFESGADELFDVIIAIGLNEDKQIKRLKERDGNNSSSLLAINRNNKFNEYKNKASYLIINDADISSFNKQILEIINKEKLNLD